MGMAALKAKIAVSEAEIAVSKAKIAASEAEIAAWKAEIAASEQHLEDLTQELEKLRAESNAAEENHEAAKSVMVDLTEETYTDDEDSVESTKKAGSSGSKRSRALSTTSNGSIGSQGDERWGWGWSVKKNADATTCSDEEKQPFPSSDGGSRSKKKSKTLDASIVYLPPEQRLNCSIGRTPDELNKMNGMVEYMGSCKFGKSDVCCKYGKVHAVVMTDKWGNSLAKQNNERQSWHNGLGEERNREARLVAACKLAIPIFHAPTKEHNTRHIFYVGHYKVSGVKEVKTPITYVDSGRRMMVPVLTFAFDRFDRHLDSIIQNNDPIERGGRAAIR